MLGRRVKIMVEQKFYSPLKIGLLIVAIAYFLFTFHAMFTLSWIGEWEGLPKSLSFIIFVEDISGTIGLVFRLAASITALTAITFYFVKKNLSKPTAYKILKWILVLEAIYWVGLLATGVFSVRSLLRGFGNLPTNLVLDSVMSTVAVLAESLAIPIVLFRLAFALKPNRPPKEAIKWGLIAGTVYVFVFWLLNTSNWLNIVLSPAAHYTGAESGALFPYIGFEYVTRYPDHILSFGVTTIGLLIVALYAAYFTKKSLGTERWRNLNLRRAGGILTAVGLYFLLIYVMWLVVGTDNRLVLIGGGPQVLDVKWSYWYAWFLGHNMDLWVLSLPLVGLPLLFYSNGSQEKTKSQ